MERYNQETVFGLEDLVVSAGEIKIPEDHKVVFVGHHIDAMRIMAERKELDLLPKKGHMWRDNEDLVSKLMEYLKVSDMPMFKTMPKDENLIIVDAVYEPYNGIEMSPTRYYASSWFGKQKGTVVV